MFYGIDKEKFYSIVQFIDNKIVPWASKKLGQKKESWN